MAMGSGLVALALMAGGPSPGPAVACPGAASDAVSYQVKVFTVAGTAWRGEGYARMKPVARQGTATIWTADRSLADSLFDRAEAKDASPRGTVAEMPAVERVRDRNYVRHLERVADGPVGRANRLALMPETGQVPEGFRAVVGGRRIDQGVLATVAIEDAQVVRVENVVMSETVQGRAGADPVDPTTVTFRHDVVAIAAGQASGEWLVPDDDVLLVSLGIHTAADARGMAVTRERLAVVDFGPRPVRPMVQADARPTIEAESCRLEVAAVAVAPGEPQPIGVAMLPPATPPSRSLPEGVDVDGKVVELPPLPEAVASADLNQIAPGTKLASPQAPAPAGAADPMLARTSFERSVTVPSLPPLPRQAPAADAANPLVDFCRRLIERMGEYEMDVDVSDDGRSCHITLRDDQVVRADGDAPCPAEAPKARAAAEVGATVEFDFNIASAHLDPAVRAASKAGDECPACPAGSGDDAACPTLAELIGDFVGGCRELIAARSPAPAATKSYPVNVRTALQAPGRTETTLVPIGDKFSLEIKTTIVPNPAAMAIQKADAPR